MRSSYLNSLILSCPRIVSVASRSCLPPSLFLLAQVFSAINPHLFYPAWLMLLRRHGLTHHSYFTERARQCILYMWMREPETKVSRNKVVDHLAFQQAIVFPSILGLPGFEMLKISILHSNSSIFP